MSESERTCCAHRHIEYRRQYGGVGYVVAEWWACRDCGTRFTPAPRAGAASEAAKKLLALVPQMDEDAECHRSWGTPAAQADMVKPSEKPLAEWVGDAEWHARWAAFYEAASATMREAAAILAALPGDGAAGEAACTHEVGVPYCGTPGCHGFGRANYEKGWRFRNGEFRPPEQEELPELVRFFREEEIDWGLKGDYENWSTERAAIELIRDLRRQLTALRRSPGAGEEEG